MGLMSSIDGPKSGSINAAGLDLEVTTADHSHYAPPMHTQNHDSSTTPMLCVMLQDRFNWVAGGYDEKPKLSYGPCQFPTLGLIVQRAWWVTSAVVTLNHT